MRKITPIALLLCLAAPVFAAEAPTLETEEQKTLYTLGFAMAQRLGAFELDEAQLALVEAGAADGFRSRDPRVPVEEYGPKIDPLLRARAGVLTEREKEAGAAFCAKAAAEPGAVRTDSGLIYRELAAGSGAAPAAGDTVKLHYHGTRIDGSVFDSSRESPDGEPATFPVDGVIPCFSEGVQRMKVGGKARLICPSDIAYGDQGAPPSIKPGATLVFEVELLEIVQSGQTEGAP